MTYVKVQGKPLLPYVGVLVAARDSSFQLNSANPHLFGMIRKLKSGEYRLYSRKKNPKTGKIRNLGTFSSRSAAEKHERAVQFFKKA